MSHGVNNDNMVQSAFNPPAQMVAVSRPHAPDRPLDAYLVRPEGDGPFPSVVVIHEIFGLNDNIRDIARRLADHGYVALAVDLFSTANRAMCMLRIFYGMLLRPLKNGTLVDLQASLDFLQGQPRVNAARVGVIGFCMGGTFALQLQQFSI
jgi:carboxymethylenebutenolidase